LIHRNTVLPTANMPERSKPGKDISVRVQIFPNSAKRNIKVKPLKAFRMRVKDDSTFADLANTALARYAKECPPQGSDAEVEAILDEAFFAVEKGETLDLLRDGEVLKLVLAPDRQDVVLDISSGVSDPPVYQTVAYPNLLGRRPATMIPAERWKRQASNLPSKVCDSAKGP
jgi:hypothetical protein